MMTSAEAAKTLGVSEARVRALIKSGQLPAKKAGRAWILREEDVMQRLASRPTSGRPRGDATNQKAPSGPMRAQSEPSERTPLNHSAHEAYLACRAIFSSLPSASMMQCAESPEEASFYMSMAEFFLRQKQEDLIKRGVF